MFSMSTPYEQGGYVNPKRRTRQALVTAAQDIVANGRAPKVEEAAAVAGVSRTTAYRYFPNQAALLAAAHPEVAAPTLLDADAPEDVAVRLDAVVVRFVELILSTEAQQRTMLRLSLDPDPQRRADLPLRQGRAIGWIETALEPLRAELGEDAIHRLTLAVRSAIGIESLVWLTEVAGVSREAAARTMRWSAAAMLSAALADGGPLA